MKEFQVTSGPFIRDKNSTKKIMFHLLIALTPIILFSFYKNGIIPFINDKVTILGMFYPLIFIILGPIFTFLTELIYVKFFLKKDHTEVKRHINSSFSIFPGLFLALVLPINTPISILFFGSVIATMIGKMLFGGFGHNVFNPALIGYLFVTVIYGSMIASNGGYLNAMEMDAITTATPLSNVALVEGIGTYETLVEPYGGLLNFFIGTIPGALGEVSALLCLLAFIYLSILKVIKWKIPVVYVGTVFAMTCIIGSYNGLGVWYPLFQVMSGGLLFGAVFMATDPVTSPTTPIAQILYGLFLGILTVLIRYLTPYPEGVMTSILLMNMFVFILDKIGSRSRFNFNRSVFSFLFAWVLIIGLSLQIGYGFKKEDPKVDTNFNVNNIETKDGKTVYTVTQKGFSGNIKAEITIEDDLIININVLEISDDYYPKVTKENFDKQLIEGQENITEVETVSGATVTSTAIKNMIINTLKDYRGE
ncbi:MAG: RnfABCDGE type electron transport complex subunit D [Bacilli bacterium]|nr:RnfABCDGE type electron transport complex subunit D [Bacilli bacterium]